MKVCCEEFKRKLLQMDVTTKMMNHDSVVNDGIQNGKIMNENGEWENMDLTKVANVMVNEIAKDLPREYFEQYEDVDHLKEMLEDGSVFLEFFALKYDWGGDVFVNECLDTLKTVYPQIDFNSLAQEWMEDFDPNNEFYSNVYEPLEKEFYDQIEKHFYPLIEDVVKNK
jgi:hypothetical protein